MKKLFLPLICFLCLGNCFAQDLEAFEFTKDWLKKIEAMAPPKPSIAIKEKRNILIFSLHTGFQHWTIPHTEAVVACIAKKSNAFTITTSKDIWEFKKENLVQYDAIVLNNTCSDFETRNLFFDKLAEDTSLSTEQRLKKAKELENNLLDYVKNGGGLMVLHGGVVMQNKSKAYGEMVGGTFDYHPKQQKFKVELVDPKHPLVKGFNGKGFEHIDEPYFFKNAYFDFDFRPLLYMKSDALEGLKAEPKDTTKYIAWIKRYGEGRVFYCSPSHNAHSFENPQLLQFLLDGMQYTVGDLVCDDSPLKGK